MSIRKLAKKYLKTREKVRELEIELEDSFTELIGVEVKLTKECQQWYKEHGEECGVPFDELNTILTRPKGVVEDIELLDSIGDLDPFNILVRFDLPHLKTLRVGLKDIK